MNTYTVVYLDKSANMFVDEGIRNVFEFLAHIAAQDYILVSVTVTG